MSMPLWNENSPDASAGEDGAGVAEVPRTGCCSWNGFSGQG